MLAACVALAIGLAPQSGAGESAPPPLEPAPVELLDFEDLDGLTGAEPDGFRLRRVRGHVASSVRTFLHGDPAGKNRVQWIQRAEAELDFDLATDWAMRLRPRILLDVLDTEYSRFEPLEAFVELRRPAWDLRAGQFIENWGIADSVNPIDVLNRRDLGSDFLDLERLGELGVRLRWFPDGGDVIGQPGVSAYVLPLWRSAQFPTEDSRWSFSRDGLRLDEGKAIEPAGADRIFAALRGTATLSTGPLNADVQLVAARGPERFPDFLRLAQPNGSAELVPVYYGMTMFGGGIRAVPNRGWWSELTLKAEVAYKMPYRTHDALPAVVPDDYVSWAAGVDHVIPGLFSDRDQLTLTVEHVGELGASDATSALRPFDNDLVLRGFWEANDFARTSLELRGLIDLDGGDLIGELVFERQLGFVHDDLQLRVGLQLFDRSLSKPSLFALFPDNSNVNVALRFDF